MDTGITTQKLFLELEEVRESAKLTIPEIAVLLGVSATTYVSWRGGTVPQAEREPDLRAAIKHIKEDPSG